MDRYIINEIMKAHAPWTVGIASRLEAKNFFYPVVYNKKTDQWFGYYKYRGKGFHANIGGCRSGSARKYYISKTDGKPLPFEKEIEIYKFLGMGNG